MRKMMSSLLKKKNTNRIIASMFFRYHLHPRLPKDSNRHPGPRCPCLMLDDVLKNLKVKLFYGIPNSQNPSGISYSNDQRRELASIFLNTDTLFVEDDAYGELNFSRKTLSSMWEFLPDQTIITGSFSKILAPGMRLGWVVAPPDIMDQLIIAKQASDLHSNYLS
jgi:2-aminoadipate transaminase